MVTQKLFFSLLLITSGLICGYLWRLWLQKGSDHDRKVSVIRKSLQKVALLCVMPITFTAAVWVVSFADVRVALLPLIGAGALLCGGLLGVGTAVLLGKSGKSRGTLFCCGSFTNIGSIGALVAFVFLGEKGFGLVALYKMLEEMTYYAIGFPVARYYSGASDKTSLRRKLIEISSDPFVRAAGVALLCGLILNLSGIDRPEFFETLNAFLVPLGTFALLVSIGLGMRFSSTTSYYVEGLCIALIKFLLVPCIAVTAGYLSGFHEIDDGLPLKVVLIASSMPVAFTALVAASIYDLDLDLANSCWLITTGSLLFIIPLLSLVLAWL